MVIKKYSASTEEDALKLARDDLGAQAVVMKVDQVRKKGFLRFFSKPYVVLTAAIDENTDPEEEKKEEGFRAIQEAIEKQTEVPPAPDSKAQQQIDKVRMLKARGDIIFDDDDEKVKDPGASANNSENSDTFISSGKDPENGIPQAVSQGSVQGTQDFGSDREKAYEKKFHDLNDLIQQNAAFNVEEESENLKKRIKEASQNGNASDEEKLFRGYIELIHGKLIENEVTEENADQIISSVRGEKDDPTAHLDVLLSSCYQKIVLMLGTPHVISGENIRKYIFFIGPTGVGKTTTIAKLASTLKLTEKKKVALVTADTYRIAAVEQLRTYANILSIPLFVIYNTEDLNGIKDDLKEYDVVLIDTAGRSNKNEKQMADIKDLLSKIPDEEKDVFLLMSASTKYKDLLKIAADYAKITDYSIIFTKLDETDQYGNILNVKLACGKALSYLTFGQNVPDDISKTDDQMIAKSLLGGGA
jgi:flagellar biosynthesis protein FlhF